MSMRHFSTQRLGTHSLSNFSCGGRLLTRMQGTALIHTNAPDSDEESFSDGAAVPRSAMQAQLLPRAGKTASVF